MKCINCKSVLIMKELKTELFYKCPKCSRAFTVSKDYFESEDENKVEEREIT